MEKSTKDYIMVVQAKYIIRKFLGKALRACDNPFNIENNLQQIHLNNSLEI